MLYLINVILTINCSFVVWLNQSFDREGKIMFVDRAMDVVDRFAIFLTRLKLSEDFSSQLFVKQYQLKLQEFGLTIDSLVANTKSSLEMMRSEIPDL